MAAPKLTEEARTFIVQSLAMFDTPKEVADAVKERYGVEIARQTVQDYDPTIGKRPAKKWIALFEGTRRAFIEETAQLATSNRAVRIRRLERMAIAAEGRKNYPLAAQLLEQIAKEVGGAFTNRRELTGKDGGPIETKSSGPNLDDMTEAELALYAQRLATGGGQ